MAEEILSIVVKYWLTFFLGIVAAGLTFVSKKFYNLWKEEKNHQKTKEQKAFYQGLEDLIIQGDANLQGQVDSIKAGVLSLQGTLFKEKCRELLDENHEITLDEYETLQIDHDAYKKLGGNHLGDALFAMVEQKESNNVSK